MIRFATIIAALMAQQATADTFYLSQGHKSGDTATFEMEGEYSAILTYSNTGAQLSVQGDWHVIAGTLECILEIEITPAQEVATPRCPPGWIVEPETARVSDGDHATFWISWSGF